MASSHCVAFEKVKDLQNETLKGAVERDWQNCRSLNDTFPDGLLNWLWVHNVASQTTQSVLLFSDNQI